MAKNSRQTALEICFQVVHQGQSLSQQLEKQLQGLTDTREKAFCTELCYGLCRYYFVLKAQLDALLKKPLKPRDMDVQIILLLGLYQLRFMRVEDHAAVNESVNLLRLTRKVWAKGLVNAVLRTCLRNQAGNRMQASNLLTPAEQRQCYPQWMLNIIDRDWAELAEDMLRSGNERAPMALRINVNDIARQDYLQNLQQQGIAAIAHAAIASSVILEKPAEVDCLPGFNQGQVSVQDSSAQIAAELLDAKPGMKVLDACAAPGGKTLHILQACENIHLTALDRDGQRLEKVSENLQRAGLTATVMRADAIHSETWSNGVQYDRILLDVPCSASGIIRRHPDIRLLRRQQDIAQLVKQQRKLLDSMWALLKPGGLIVYSTCSIFKDENENQLGKFLQAREDCVERPINTVQWGVVRPVGRQILTGSNNMDGFYYACLEKTNPE